MFLYSLLALAVVTALIFARPSTGQGVGDAGSRRGGSALGVGNGGRRSACRRTHRARFVGDRRLPLRATLARWFPLFRRCSALIVSVGAVAAVLYSRDISRITSDANPGPHLAAPPRWLFAVLGDDAHASAGRRDLLEGGFSFSFSELMTVASFLLILFDAERREVRRAALAYMDHDAVGFALLLIGFVRLASVCGSADFALLGEYFRTQPALPLFVEVFLAGFGAKAGMFPMHVWLPEAHPAAPSHVSALMSGVMIKTGVYGILRVTAQIADLPTLRCTAGLIRTARRRHRHGPGA